MRLLFILLILFPSISFSSEKDEDPLRYYNFIQSLTPEDTSMFLNIEIEEFDFFSEKPHEETIIQDVSLMREMIHYQADEIMAKSRDFSTIEKRIFSFVTKNISNTDRLNFLRDISPENLFEDEEWAQILRTSAEVLDASQQLTIEKLSRELPRPANSYDADGWIVSHLLTKTQTCLESIEDYLETGDVIIGVGNTPTFLLEALKEMHANALPYTVIEIPISSHPGAIKNPNTWIKDIITPDALETYRNFLESSFLSALENNSTGKIWFIDIVDRGFGSKFLIRELGEMYPKYAAQFKFMALNKIDRGRIRFDLGEENMISLGLPIAGLLDQSDDWRFLPGAPAWKWTSVIPLYEQDPEALVSENAKHVLTHISERLYGTH